VAGVGGPGPGQTARPEALPTSNIAIAASFGPVASPLPVGQPTGSGVAPWRLVLSTNPRSRFRQKLGDVGGEVAVDDLVEGQVLEDATQAGPQCYPNFL
jgi:hypothetical protein